MRKILIILDGVTDFGDKTALSLSNHPNLDFLAKNGLTGLMWPIKGIAPESGESQFVILGQEIKNYPGRGILEALGINLKINSKNVYLRGNFAEFKKNKITKIRTNIPNKNVINKLNEIDSDIKIIPTIGYRTVMIVKNASPDITNTHPGYKKINGVSNAINIKLNKLKCKGDKKTSFKINNFIEKAEELMKNKTILIRGAGNKIPKIKKLKDWSLMADMPIEIGIAKLLGMKILSKKNFIKKIIKRKNNIYIQIKGPDTYGHLGDLSGKIKSIEKIDRLLAQLSKIKNTLICIAADHATPYQLKRHSKDPVPILIFGKGKDNIKKFDENNCKKGSLRLEGKDLMKFLEKL